MASPNDIYLFGPDPADGINDIRLRDNSAVVSGTPISRTPSASVSTWVIGAIAVVLGAISVTPAPATSQWVGVSPNVQEGPNSGNPAVCVQSWSVPTITPSVSGISATPAPAIRTWTVPAPAIQVGPLTASPSVATSQWVGLSPNVLEGPDQASPAVAVSTWVVLDPSASVPGLPQTVNPAVATSAWVVPTVFAGEPVTNLVTGGRIYPWVKTKWAGQPQHAFPDAAPSKWRVLGPDTELGDVSRTVDPATTDWVVKDPQIETAPDPDEELLIMLMAEVTV